MKFKDILTEGSYEDFIMHNSEEIQEAVDELEAVDGSEVSESGWDSIQEKMKIYDPEIADWVDANAGVRVDVRELAQTAINNENRTGTEARMILSAIFDYVAAVDSVSRN